jgi:hypothetical protein
MKLLLHSKGVTDFGVAGENIWPYMWGYIAKLEKNTLIRASYYIKSLIIRVQNQGAKMADICDKYISV